MCCTCVYLATERSYSKICWLSLKGKFSWDGRDPNVFWLCRQWAGAVQENSKFRVFLVHDHIIHRLHPDSHANRCTPLCKPHCNTKLSSCVIRWIWLRSLRMERPRPLIFWTVVMLSFCLFKEAVSLESHPASNLCKYKKGLPAQVWVKYE